MSINDQIEALREEFNCRLDVLKDQSEETPFRKWMKAAHPGCDEGSVEWWHRKHSWNDALEWADEKLHRAGFAENSSDDIRPMLKRGKEN